ncbi:MAG TPA: hypothetical protein VFS21_23680 [Roseiflexaceae bacterium]|nr:hypothetical protein [Roseiflexaceae bacterium]
MAPPTLIHIQQVRPLPQYNEYEALVDALVDGQPLCLHALIYRPDDWRRFAPGAAVPAALWLERDGPVERLAAAGPPALAQIEAARYEAIGTVRSVDGERLILDTTLPLSVDLDLPPQQAAHAPPLRPGDPLRVVGVMKADLYPD